MDQQKRARWFGYTAVVLAILFRLQGAGVPAQIVQWLRQPRVKSFLIFLETGQYVRSFDSIEEEAAPIFSPDYACESPAPSFPEAEEVLPVFSPEDSFRVTYSCKAEAPLETLLTQQLEWALDSEAPSVLILHTHTTESYTPFDDTYIESTPYRTLDEDFNMLSIGDRVAQLLEDGGIHVIHDRTLHDYPSYNSAYSHARKSIRSILEEHPGIQLILDLHRDAAATANGQLRTQASISGQDSAQLMLVMGTGNGGESNPYWLDNLSLGLKLHAAIERQHPGLMRPISLRSQRFNQDLQPYTLLVEVGAAGNSHEEALLAAQALADGILTLKHGSQ